jgi:hypothetical protein
MTRVKKLVYVALIALTLAGGAAYAPSLASGLSTPTLAAPPPSCDDDPDYCDDAELARKGNEFKGQHFADGGDPSQWG